MDINFKSLEEMVREIIASLRAGEKGRPRYTLLLGSGFSYPIVPTARQMVEGDVAWWRYHREQKIAGEFCRREDGIAAGLAKEIDIAEFERDIWGQIHVKASSSPKTDFPIAANGLPDLANAGSVGLAYQALMADGLFNNQMRRQYLRDAIKRSGRRVNGAHIFLASILSAQEDWDNGATFCRTIFTTNFDPLLQRSLQIVNKLYYMSDRPALLEPPDDDESDAIHLIYTHGSVHRYDLLNTEDQIARARNRNAPNLIEYFQRRGVIVIGYSGWADTTMKALTSCASFDLNLYWCDIHPTAKADGKLRPEALKLLKARGKKAFYVQITGAGEPMRLLHRALDLNPVPKFIRSPVETMIEQLRSIDVSSEPAASFTTEAVAVSDDISPISGGTPTDPESTKSASLGAKAAPLSADLKTILDGTLTRLGVAQSAFENPTVVQSAGGRDDVAKALVAQLLSDALVAYWQGKRDEAIRLWRAVIETDGVPSKDRAVALYSRGVTWGVIGDTPKEIDDYTAVIDMPDAPAELKAQALYNRGVTCGQSGDRPKAIADYTAVIDMPDAPAEQKAKALNNRGVASGEIGDTPKAIADYTTVIDMADAPAEQKALTLVNRGIAMGLSGDTSKAIADYTAVIDMPDAPAEQKAKALVNRGFRWGVIGDTAKAIADYTAVIDMPDAPSDQKAKALYNRGVDSGQSGDTPKAIADYTAVIEMPDAPVDQKAKALFNRGVTWGQSGGDTPKEIADYTAVIDMADAPAEQKALSLVNRGVTWGQNGDTLKGIADYTAVIDMPDAPAEQKAQALVNRGLASGQSGDTLKAIADYTAVINMPDAPVDQKAKALVSRGFRWGVSGETLKEIADYDAAIDMPDAPVEQKAKALFNRGVTWGQSGDTPKEIADYTAVIDMADAPAEQKALALVNRGITWEQSGDKSKAIADFTTVIEMADAPSEQKAHALVNRGVATAQSGDTPKAIADYTVVINMPDAPARQKATALVNRGLRWGVSGDTQKAIADYTAVVDMHDAPSDQKAKAFAYRGQSRFSELDDAISMIDDSKKALELAEGNITARSNLALGLLLTGQQEAARTEYESLLSRTSDTAVIQSTIDDLERAVRVRSDVDGVASMLELLRKAVHGTDRSREPSPGAE